ncbi:hypothetical protein GCM10009593_09430 [Microlunatus antarcticus]
MVAVVMAGVAPARRLAIAARVLGAGSRDFVMPLVLAAIGSKVGGRVVRTYGAGSTDRSRDT